MYIMRASGKHNIILFNIFDKFSCEPARLIFCLSFIIVTNTSIMFSALLTAVCIAQMMSHQSVITLV